MYVRLLLQQQPGRSTKLLVSACSQCRVCSCLPLLQSATMMLMPAGLHRQPAHGCSGGTSAEPGTVHWGGKAAHSCLAVLLGRMCEAAASTTVCVKLLHALFLHATAAPCPQVSMCPLTCASTTVAVGSPAAPAQAAGRPQQRVSARRHCV